MWFIAPRIATSIIPGVKTKSYIKDDISVVKGNLLINKAVNMVTLFVPNVLLKGDQGNTLKISSPQFIRQISRYSIISNITPFVFIVFFVLFIKKRIPLDLIFLGIVPLFLYWLIYLNQYYYWFNYGAGFFHLYYFTVPILLSIVFDRLFIKGTKPLLLLFSYIVFMSINLFLITNIHTKAIYASYYAQIAEYLIIIMFFLLAVYTLIYFHKIKHAR
jgi:hypothetical protein